MSAGSSASTQPLRSSVESQRSAPSAIMEPGLGPTCTDAALELVEWVEWVEEELSGS